MGYRLVQLLSANERALKGEGCSTRSPRAEKWRWRVGRLISRDWQLDFAEIQVAVKIGWDWVLDGMGWMRASGCNNNTAKTIQNHQRESSPERERERGEMSERETRIQDGLVGDQVVVHPAAAPKKSRSGKVASGIIPSPVPI